MDYVALGNSNLKVSRFCLGTIPIPRAALAGGVNFIDTADVYSGGVCEQIVGKALEGTRDKVVLASKGGMKMGPGVNDTGISRFHLVRAVEASLRRLKTDRIDLYYIHWPFAQMNLDEALRALDDLVRQGKILYAACSNFPAWLVCRSNWVCDKKGYVPLVCGQYPYNLIERGLEIEVLPMAASLGFGITVYRPLAVGVLTGKYLDALPEQTRGVSDERVPKWTREYAEGLRKLEGFAKEQGYSAADAASAWIYSHPAVSSVIVGISTLKQLEQNLKGFELKLTAEQRATISGYFDTEVWEEAGGGFGHWRRSYEIGGRV